MKYLKIFFSALMFFALLISSCKKDDTTNNSTSNIIQQGTWRVTHFSEDGNDQTSNFNGYTFSFNNDGTVRANFAGGFTNGTWSENDSSTSKLILNFNAASPLDDLNEDWHILSKTSTKIEMEHVSGGNGGTDLLTLEKN